MARPPHRAPVFRLRPRRHRKADLVEGTLDIGGWSEPTRLELNEWLTTQQPDTGDFWSFVMTTAKAEAIGAILEAIVGGPRGYATLRVFASLGPYLRRDTGEILCTQHTLAKTAKVSAGDVQRALIRLVEIGVLLKEGRGRYRVHPSVMWKGELANREKVEAVTPALTLVKGGRDAKSDSEG
jgi:hypothetical protein